MELYSVLPRSSFVLWDMIAILIKSWVEMSLGTIPIIARRRLNEVEYALAVIVSRASDLVRLWQVVVMLMVMH